MRRPSAVSAIVVIAALMSACTSSAPPTGSVPLPSSRDVPSASPAPPKPTPEPEGMVHLDRGSIFPLESAAYIAIRSGESGFWLLGSAEGIEPGSLLMVGQPDGTRWRQMRTTPFGPELVDITDGPMGTVIAQRIDDPETGPKATRLWFSEDREAFVPVTDLDNVVPEAVFSGPAGFALVGGADDAEGTTVRTVWTSAEGRTWVPPRAGIDDAVDVAIVTREGFFAFGTGISGGLAAFMSQDGIDWSRDAGGTSSPFGSEGMTTTRPVLVGPTISVVRSDGTVWAGEVSADGSVPRIDWRHVDVADALFTGASTIAAAASADGATVIGFDRSTLDPIAWTSPDGREWQRHDLDPAVFGGGVPDLLGRYGSVSVALGFAVNGDGQIIRRPWVSDGDGSRWTAVDDMQFGLLPPTVEGPCPDRPPSTVKAIAALARELGPTCFGRTSFAIKGFVGTCECGGAALLRGQPGWLIDGVGLGTLYLASARSDSMTGEYPTWIDPGRRLRIPKVGRPLEVTGHFDDPAAQTCRLVPEPGLPVEMPPRDATVAECRQHFVVTAIR